MKTLWARLFGGFHAVVVLIVAGIGLAQNGRPDFTGTWRPTATSRGPVVESRIEIKQTASRFSIRHLLGSTTTGWSIYPTDGTMIKTKGRNRVETIGHWEKNMLILEVTGPGNAPWRRSTTRQTLWLSESGRVLTIQFHELSDKEADHDYAMEFERVQ